MSKAEEEKQIADKFANYSDAIVAVSFVNTLAFFVAILEPDVRCSLTDFRIFVVLSGVLLQVAYFGALMYFRSVEVKLRMAYGGYDSELAQKYSKQMHIFRLVFVVLLGVGLAVLSWHGLIDPSCNKVDGI